MTSPCDDCIHNDKCDDFDKKFCSENDYDKYLPETEYYNFYTLKDEDD